MKNTPVRDSLVVFKEGARVNFKLYGRVMPVFGCNLNGEPQIIGVEFKNRADKEAFRSMISKKIASGELKEFVLVSEAWTAEITDQEEYNEWVKEHGSLENFPGREEIVSILYCSPEEEIQFTAAIDRSTMPVLGEWEMTSRKPSIPSVGGLSSRFQDLFVLGKSGQN